MKKLNALLIGLIANITLFAQADPTVLTIEGEDVKASEFMYIYSKNNDNPSFDKDSLDDYMQLFINYKLKVREAKEMKYDTIPSLVKELAQYRKQLSLPYMIDKEKNEALIEEAYKRTTEEIRASHILIRVDANAAAQDTMAAYSRIMNLRSRILKGENFEEVARGKGGSDDPSVSGNGGDLGYFSALQMVYPFEDAAFKTQVGQISMPVRTRFGYHLIQVNDRREARGTVEVAHILILSKSDAPQEEKDKAEKKINEIYELIQNGEPFGDVASKYSEDQSSRAKGGKLPAFGSGSKQRMVPAFEEVAFNLENDGDVSKPFRTAYGFHIIKRIQRLSTPSYEEIYRELKVKVERDLRAEKTRASFIEQLKKEYNYTDQTEKYFPFFYNEITDDIFLGKWSGLVDKSILSETIASFKDNRFTVNDFHEFVLARQKKMPRQDVPGLIKKWYRQFINKEITAYEDSQLEMKYPEFKSLMQEYSDGILVFEIMQDEIWKKASNDSIGIQNYYEMHKADFTYPTRYKGDLFKCKDKSTAKAIYKLIKSEKMTAKEIETSMNKDSELNVTLKSQTFNAETTEAFQYSKKGVNQTKAFKTGLNKPYQNGDSYYIMNVEEVLAPRAREFSEAKGLVTAAYQNELEQKWLEGLRKKYTIKIHEEALYNLGNK